MNFLNTQQSRMRLQHHNALNWELQKFFLHATEGAVENFMRRWPRMTLWLKIEAPQHKMDEECMVRLRWPVRSPISVLALWDGRRRHKRCANQTAEVHIEYLWWKFFSVVVLTCHCACGAHILCWMSYRSERIVCFPVKLGRPLGLWKGGLLGLWEFWCATVQVRMDRCGFRLTPWVPDCLLLVELTSRRIGSFPFLGADEHQRRKSWMRLYGTCIACVRWRGRSVRHGSESRLSWLLPFRWCWRWGMIRWIGSIHSLCRW